MAEYAVSNRIDDDTALAWWVHYVFRKRDRIIAKSKTKYWRTTHKYGVSLPKTASETLELDRQTGNPLWENYLKQYTGKAEISNEEVECCTPEEVQRGEVGELRIFQEITCHILFDVKMDFLLKARYVTNGAMTDTLVGLCYSSFVSCDSVRIVLLVAALNDLDILAYDISNVYLNAPCRERIWFVAGLECGRSLEGKVMKPVRAFYGLKDLERDGGRCSNTKL